jgi:hypothetical protein
MSKQHLCFAGHGLPRRGQSFLGAAASLAIVGAILLYYTNAFASHCRADPKAPAGRGACAGLAAAAHQLQAPLSVCVIACVAVFVIAFIRSLLS